MVSHHVNQYEAGSMGMFYKGRTETVRPCTLESTHAFNALKQAAESSSTEDKLKFAAQFRTAQKAHNNVIKECLGADGFDRHLSALKYHAMLNNIKV